MSSVDVIMAAYNVESFVGAAVRSILDQSVRDLRLIVVDDGSTDKTSHVLRSFSDTRMILISTENRGVCHARNRALQEVTAPYVAVMDSDDICHCDRLSSQVTHLQQNPELVGVGCWVWLMTPTGRRVYEDRCQTGVEAVLSELYKNGGGVYPATCVMRTESVRKIGGYRPAIPVSEDLDLLLRLTQFGGLDNVPEALYSYRLNTRSLTFSSKARRDYYASVALKLSLERHERGTDSLDEGVLPAPWIRSANIGDKPYTLRHVLAYLHRQAAIESVGRNKRTVAIRDVLISLGYSPLEAKTCAS